MKSITRGILAAVAIASSCGPAAAQAGFDTGQHAFQLSGTAISGSLTSTTPTDGKTIVLRGTCNVTVFATGLADEHTGGWLMIERSFDNGGTWADLGSLNPWGAGNGDSYVVDDLSAKRNAYLTTFGGGANAYSTTFYEPEAGVLYRAVARHISAGVTLAYRLSQ